MDRIRQSVSALAGLVDDMAGCVDLAAQRAAPDGVGSKVPRRATQRPYPARPGRMTLGCRRRGRFGAALDAVAVIAATASPTPSWNERTTYRTITVISSERAVVTDTVMSLRGAFRTGKDVFG